MLENHFLLVFMNLLPNFRSLQKIFDTHLILFAKSGDKLNQIPISNEDIKKEFKNYL